MRATSMLALAALAACSPVAPVDGPMFWADTSRAEMSIPVRGDTAGFRLVGRLASPHGKRRIVLVGEGAEQEVAAGGWNLPPSGVRSGGPGPDQGAMALCWNALSGGDSSADRMPHPSDGLVLLCRYRSADGVLGPPLNMGFGVPTWLRDVAVDSEGAFAVEMLRDRAGTLFGTSSPGDGLYRARLSGGEAGAAVLVQTR